MVGAASQSRFPFGRMPLSADPAAAEREATVLSQPRTGDSGSSVGRPPLPPVNLPAPSPTSLKLFPQQQNDSEAAIAGETLGHFIIRSRIGAGGMGTVFLADDEKLQRQVALKVLSPNQTADPASLQRFLNEARSAARLDHDHIARVFFYGDDHGLHYIAYEYVQGHNLRDLIRAQGRIEPAQVIAYAVQLTDALCHTSAMGVVHRDIKPSNIIITLQGKAKLVDLGLARQESLEESAQLTVAGTTLGTFDYISPEQAKDPRNVDVRSDIYSLGCTLYHALTGEPPFPEGTVLQRLLQHHDNDPPDPALKNRRVSPAVSAVVRKMMASDPRRRYPSAEALLHDLVLIASAMGLRTTSDNQASLSTLLKGSQNAWSPYVGWLSTAAALVVSAVVWQASPIWLPADTGNDPAIDAPAILAGESGAPTNLGQMTETVPESEADSLTGISRFSPLRTGDSSSGNKPALTSSAAAGTSTDQGTSTLPSPVADSLFRGEEQPPFSLSMTEPRGATPAADRPGNSAALNPVTVKPAGTPSETSPLSSQLAATANDSLTLVDRTGSRAAISGDLPPAVAPAAIVAEPFVISGTSKSYPSLEAACAEIREQGVIELNFDGRLPNPERPLRLIGKRITLQAARGRRPVLVFAPKTAATDPLQSRMIVVSGGSLSLSNISLEFQIRQPALVDRWVLFRLERPERLRLEDVFVTVRNPGNASAAIVECAGPTASFSRMPTSKEASPQMTTEIFVDQSVLRGEAVAFHLRDPAAYRCRLRQSFFAVSEWLLDCEMPADSMTVNTRIAIELEQSTCLLGQGLARSARIESLSGGALPLEISAHGNVISCGPGAALVEQLFTQDMMELRQPRFNWSSDRNQFDGLQTLWLARFESRAEDQRWSFEDWRNYYRSSGELESLNNQSLGWPSKWRQQPWSGISPATIKADLQASALASGSILDEPDAGANWELLPPEPASADKQP